jgi:hypothetical protein
MLKFKIMLSLKRSFSPWIAGQNWLQKERFGQCFGSAFKPFFGSTVNFLYILSFDNVLNFDIPLDSTASENAIVLFGSAGKW